MLNYSCAVLNAKIVGDDRIYFVPIRVCIGKYDKKNNLFYDYLSNSVIPNLSDSAYLNFDNAFSHVTSFLSVFKSSKSLSFNESIQKFLLANRKKVTIARFDDEIREYIKLDSSCNLDSIGHNVLLFRDDVLEVDQLYYSRLDIAVFPIRKMPIFFEALNQNTAKITLMHSRDIVDFDSYIASKERANIREEKLKNKI